MEVAKVEESCVGPTLLVLGVAVREWFGTIHNDEAYRLAAELNRRASERAPSPSNHDDVQDAAQGER